MNICMGIHLMSIQIITPQHICKMCIAMAAIEHFFAMIFLTFSAIL